jgi:DUF1680 family protein
VGGVGGAAIQHQVARPLGLGAVTLDVAGHLGAWQHLNAVATIPHCVANLEASGALDNLRRLVGLTAAPYRGQRFADSDVYKTLEAVAWELGRAPTPAPELRDFMVATTALIRSVRTDEGYVNSWFQRNRAFVPFADLPWGHEMYCAGHLIQAAVAAARAGVDPGLLEIARRFADLLVERFGEGREPGICGHPEIEMALVELFRFTGEAAYLKLAGRMVDLRGHDLLGDCEFGPGYCQDEVPVRDAVEARGHAVRQVYLAAGATDVYVETGDASLLDAMERLWEDVYGRKAYVSGGLGSRERDEAFGDAYDQAPDLAYAETCAAIAGFMWNWRLLLATGRGRYADEMERTLYNAIACGVSMDGVHFFYANPLQVRAGASVLRQSWFDCACCPPNLARLVASLQQYVATLDEQGLQLHLYAQGRVVADGPFGSVEVEVETDYPWVGHIRLTVRRSQARPWTLSLRTPAWCQAARIALDGVAHAAAADDRGYVPITRTWSEGTTVDLELDMPVKAMAPDPRVEAVRGCAALTRGPILYCVEGPDAGAALSLDVEHLPEPASPVDGIAPVVLSGRALTPAGEVALSAVPYFRWANRGPHPMRVWLPTTQVTR